MVLVIFYWLLISSSSLNNLFTLAARLEQIINDCYNIKGKELCGVCGRTDLRNNSNTLEKCTYPFTYRFKVKVEDDGKCNPSSSDGFCEEIKYHCKSDSCLNGGTCHEGFGTFRCHCTKTHHGMRCEYEKKNNKKYSAGIQVFISQTVIFNRNATLIISTDVSGSDLLIKLESEISNLNFVDTPDPRFNSYTTGDMRKKYCMDLTGLEDNHCRFISNATNDVYTMTYNFPVINERDKAKSESGPPVNGIMIYKGNEFPPQQSEKRLGYIANITITAYQIKRPASEDLPFLEMEHLPVFKNTYPIFVSYNNQTWCIACPTLIGQQCNTNPRKIPVYPPNEPWEMHYHFENMFENWWPDVDKSKFWRSACHDPNEDVKAYLNNYPHKIIRILNFEYFGRVVFPNYLGKNSEVKSYTSWNYTSFEGNENWRKPSDFNHRRLDTGIVSLEFHGHVSFHDYYSHPKWLLEELKRSAGYTPGNYVRCFYEIRRVSLTPYINLGINQTFYVNTEDGVVIDARKSVNLNMRDGIERLMKWSCKLGDTNTPCFSGQVFNDTAEYFQVGPNVLKISNVYNFSLKLYEEAYHRTTAYAFIAVEVGSNRPYVIRLKCLNCWSGIIAFQNDYNILFLSHEGNLYNVKHLKYQWFYKEVNEVNFKPADDIRVNDTDRYVFKIEKYSLEQSKTYDFYVSIEDVEPKVATRLRVKLPEKHILGCDVKPEGGVRGVTLFDIICHVVPQVGVSYTYEFFDKSGSDEKLFGGRMLGSSTNSDLFKFRLTRGNVSVLSFDSHKVTEEYTILVHLEPFNESVSYIDELMDILKTDSAIGWLHLRNSERDLALPSAISDILTDKLKRDYLIKDLVFNLAQSQTVYISEIKLCLSSIRNIVVSMSENLEQFTLPTDVGRRCADLLLIITTKLVYRVYHGQIEKTLTKVICQQLSRYVIETVSIVLRYKNKEVLNNGEEFVDPKVLDLVQMTSHEMVKSLEQISLMLLWLQTPGDSPSEIKTGDISSWVKAGLPKDVHQAAKALISRELAGGFRNDSYIGVQFMRMDIDPFWWASGNIVSNVLLVLLCNKKQISIDCGTIRSLPFPIKLYYDIKSSVESIKPIIGEANSFTKSMSDEEKDSSLTVYRFVPPVRAKLFVKFSFDANDLREYKVLFKTNKRPDCDDMSEEALLINNNNTVYNITYEKNDEDNVFYMGILLVNSPLGHGGTFKLKIYYVQCTMWLKWQWSHRGCWVGSNTGDTTLECECFHLSLFTGTVFIPENDKFEFFDFKLFLIPQLNFLPFLTMVVLIVLYLLFFTWSALSDKDDLNRQNIIILEDNYPRERYGYLIAVYTGFRIRSGTRANVGIKLMGSQSDSRPHVLMSSDRRTLRSNSDDWFLIFCPSHLGRLVCLHVWHDNASCQPDWFLDKVTVYDLTKKCEFTFHVYEWIAFNSDTFPDVLIAPVGSQDRFKKSRVFRDNLTAGLRDSHYWGSVLWKHPRDPMKRVYRMQAVFCYALAAMVVSLLIYLTRYSFPGDEDDPSYELTSFDGWALVISILSASLLSTVTMCLLSNSFMSASPRKLGSLVVGRENFESSSCENMFARNEGRSTDFKHFDRVILTSNFDEDLKGGKEDRPEGNDKAMKGWRAALYRTLKRSQLVPAQTSKAKNGLLVRKNNLICIWVIVAITTLTCCFVVLTYSWYLEPIHGYEWLTIYIATIILDVFVFQTLKVIISSALLSLLFTRAIQADPFLLDRDEDSSDKALRDSLDTIIERRSKNIYLPLSHKRKDAYLKKLYRRSRWETIFAFFALALFLSGMVAVSDTFTGAAYASNRHVTSVVSRGHLTSHPQDFREISNRTELEDFLQHNLVAQAYRFMWYNLAPLSEAGRRPDWTDDCVSRLVGGACLRQLRAAGAGACPPSLPDRRRRRRRRCAPPRWSEAGQDRDAYHPGWASGPDGDSLAPTAPWRYAPPDGVTSSRCYGATGTLYPAGGYFARLGGGRREARHAIASLLADSWLGAATRALFAQLTLYNANAGLFSHVVLVAEHVPAGGFLPRVRVESVAVALSLHVWDVVFAAFLVVFTARSLLLLDKLGVRGFFSEKLYRLEAIVICLGYVTVAAYFVHVHTANKYVDEYQRRGLSEIFSFLIISKYSYLYQTTAFIFYFCLVLRLLCSLRFGKVFLRFYNTLQLSCGCLFWLIPCFFIALAVLWKLIGYSMYAFIFVYETSLFIILHPENLFVLDKSAKIPLSCKIFLVVISILSTAVMGIVVMLFAHFYKLAQGYKIVDVYNYDFVEFIRDELKRVIGPKSKSKR